LRFIGERARLAQRLPRSLWKKPGEPSPPESQPASAPRQNPQAVYEFEPLVAFALKDQARVLLAAAVVSSAVVILLALAFNRSLKQREALRDELERGRRLAALGEMSAVLAHELRNPLASLKGHAQLLLERLPSAGPEHEKSRRVVNEAVRLENLMNDLLDFIRSGELSRRPCDPNEILRAAVEQVGPERVSAAYAPAPRRWSLDAPRLQQVLSNVLSNALQASPPDQRPEAAVREEGRALIFSVRDFGAGVPAGEEERIFEPFYTKRVRGIGLGLAVARRIVELHGGEITASKHPGGGALFTVRVPWRKG
jgi:two-component system sensor histidine kinase HydH